MRNRVSATRSRILAQAAAIALLAGTGAACSDATRLREPFFTGSTANQRDIINGEQSAAIPADGSVTSQALPPPGAEASAGGAWSAAGGSVVVVGPGESLDTLAIKYGVPPSEIARANGISSPSQLTAGRTIVIPRRNSAPAYAAAEGPAMEAMPVSTPPAPVKATPAIARKGSGTLVRVVAPGETLYSIARSQGVSVGDIVALNQLSSDSLQVGQRLKMPGGKGGGEAMPKAETVALKGNLPPTRGAAPKPLGTLTVKQDGTPVAPIEAPQPATETAAMPPIPAVPQLPNASATPTVTAAAQAVDDAVGPASTNGTSFRWPVRGRIISGFGSKPNGERNDGINLAVPEGTTVKAAEAGVVIYAGNELAGYGNLVLVRHADGWVSAYAHNSQIQVKKGDKVNRGQTVGQAGMTGSVTAPQVHFELRRGAKPVNPLDYLEGA